MTITAQAQVLILAGDDVMASNLAKHLHHCELETLTFHSLAEICTQWEQFGASTIILHESAFQEAKSSLDFQRLQSSSTKLWLCSFTSAEPDAEIWFFPINGSGATPLTCQQLAESLR